MNLRVLLYLAFLVAPPVFAQDYEIRLHRPYQVGAKERISVVGKDVREVYGATQGQVLRQEKKERMVELNGVLTVLAVGSKGKISRLSVEIEKFVQTQAGARNDVLPSNTVVIASRPDKKTVFEVGGTVVQPEVARALELVISLGDLETQTTDDELFGTPERKRVGQSWEINEPAVTAVMDENSTLPVTNVSGTVTLKEVFRDAAGRRLRLAFEARADTALPNTAGGSPPQALVIMKGTKELPVDSNLQRTKETTETSVSMLVRSRSDTNGPEVLRRLLSIRSTSITSTPIK